jgi:hypothetical protein
MRLNNVDRLFGAPPAGVAQAAALGATAAAAP